MVHSYSMVVFLQSVKCKENTKACFIWYDMYINIYIYATIYFPYMMYAYIGAYKKIICKKYSPLFGLDCNIYIFICINIYPYVFYEYIVIY